MKRFIIFALLGIFSMASLPSDSQATALADRDRDRDSKNSALKLKPKKVSKNTAKLRKQQTRDRNKHMADIKKSNQRASQKRK